MDRYALGHTLVELLVVLGLVAIVATFAVPAFAELRANAARDERVSRLVRTLQLARVEALAHGRPVVVCAAGDAHRCADGAEWSAGWLAYVAPPPGRAADPRHAVLVRVDGRPAPAVRSTRGAIEFSPTALAATTATLVVCDRRGAPAARAVVVSRTGRVRVSARDADGGPLACP